MYRRSARTRQGKGWCGGTQWGRRKDDVQLRRTLTRPRLAIRAKSLSKDQSSPSWSAAIAAIRRSANPKRSPAACNLDPVIDSRPRLIAREENGKRRKHAAQTRIVAV